jgi:prevent-host-death family protein
MPARARRIGIRELKATLSECIRDVKAGRTLIVTEHGDPVARMIPETAPISKRLEALRKAGTVAWSGRRLRRIEPVASVRGTRTVADLVSENRE